MRWGGSGLNKPCLCTKVVCTSPCAQQEVLKHLSHLWSHGHTQITMGRIRWEKRNRTINSDWAGNFIPVWRYKTQPWKKPSSILSNLHWSNVKACKTSIPFGRLADTVSALHMVGSAQPKCWVVLIPHGSLRWDERGKTHISSSASLIEECQSVVANWNDKILLFFVYPMEMQGMIKVCT